MVQEFFQYYCAISGRIYEKKSTKEYLTQFYDGTIANISNLKFYLQFLQKSLEEYFWEFTKEPLEAFIFLKKSQKNIYEVSEHIFKWNSGGIPESIRAGISECFSDRVSEEIFSKISIENSGNSLE